MADITTCLMGNNLFNLTDTPLTLDIQHWINKGGKYNPHVQKPIHHRLKQFVVSFYQCVNKIFKRSNFRRKVIQGTSTIHSDLNKFKLANPTSSDLNWLNFEPRIIHFETASVQEPLETNSLQQTERNPNIRSSAIFTLQDGRLILESDKKLGFVVLDTATYLDAYLKISQEQHFKKVHITEEWYISHILNFIKEAQAALPIKLKNIVKPKDFEVEIEAPSLGYLPLLPKIQKLNVVDHTQVHCWNAKVSKLLFMTQSPSSRKSWIRFTVFFSTTLKRNLGLDTVIFLLQSLAWSKHSNISSPSRQEHGVRLLNWTQTLKTCIPTVIEISSSATSAMAPNWQD